MYDINFKNIKKGYIFGFVFFIIGLIMLLMFLGLPLMTSNMMKNSENKYDSQTTGIKSSYTTYKNDEGTTMYTPIYEFEVDGVKYSCKSRVSSNSKIGEESSIIYYNKLDPNDCMPKYETTFFDTFILFSIVPLIFVIIGLIFILSIRKKVKKAKYLAQNGTLIKNIPYTMVNSNIEVNGRRLQSIAINYTFPDGTTKELIGNPRYDRKTGDQDNLVDLLIDPADPTNYYIDFNIDQKY